MARKSRKQGKAIAYEEKIHSVLENLTGIYTRLSVEDNGYETTGSIENQIALLKEFVEKQEGFRLVDVYIDNGTTGTNFDRKEWNHLMEDVKNRKINCVVVKDFSRIGRNYIEVGNYLEKVFPFLGVRIIAVNENYDSSRQSFDNSMLANSLTNIVNEYYARDISKKVIQAKRTMQKKGEFVSGVLPYGYQRPKEDRKKLVIDRESADVVKKIFQWRLQGKGCLVIANYLNELAIPSPGMYRYMNGNQSFKRSRDALWKSKHVAGILTNPVYLGHMVQGKTRSSYFERDGKMQSLPKDKWIIVENTHEQLVSQDHFNITVAMAESSRKRHEEQMNVYNRIEHFDNPLRKKLFCGQCGGLLTRRSRVVKGIRDYCYFCTAPKSKIGMKCTNTHIHEVPLMEAIVEAADCQLRVFGKLENGWKQYQQSEFIQKKISETDSKKRELDEAMKKLRVQRQELYADMKDGILTIEDYEYEKMRLIKRIEQLDEEIRKIEEINRNEDDIGNVLKQYRRNVFQALCNNWAAGSMAMDGENNILKNTEFLDLLDKLIDKIVVYSPDRIEITYVYADELEKWTRIL